MHTCITFTFTRLYTRFPALLLIVLVCAGSSTHADEAGEQAVRLQQLRDRISDIQDELGAMRGKQAALQRELKAAEISIGKSSAELRRLRQEQSRMQARMQTLEGERKQQQALLQEMRLQLAHDLRTAYLAGRQEQVKLLLNQEDPATVSRILAYHGYFARARSHRMQQLRDTLAGLAATEQDIIAQQQQLDTLLESQRTQSRLLAGEKTERSRVLVKLQDAMQGKSSELAQLQQDEQQLQELVLSLQQALRDIPPAIDEFHSLQELKGKLQWPVAGRVSMRYGTRQAGGKLKSRGIRISAAAGSDVHAVARGRVAYADWLRGFGLLLILDHGNGYMSLYGNNRTLYKEVGEWVNGHEVIAAVGDSGGQSRSGLYLEMRKKGRPFNPGPWFADKPAAVQAGR